MKKNKKKKEINGASQGELSLPTNRKQLYFDCLKQRWRSIYSIGLIFFLTMVPFIVFLFIRRVNYSFLYKQEGIKEYELMFNNIIYFLLASFCLIIPAIFLGGLLKNLRNITFLDPLFFKEDFFGGIKDSFTSIFVSTLIYILFLSGTLITLSIKDIDTVIKGVMVSLTLLIFFPMLLLIYHQSALYTNKFKNYLFNSFYLFIKNFFYMLLLTFVNLIPLAFIFVSNPIIFVTCLCLYFIFIEPLILLFDMVFLNFIFDESMNKKYYPEIYKKGLFDVKNKNGKGDENMFTINSTYNDVKNNLVIGKFAPHLFSFRINPLVLDHPYYEHETLDFRESRTQALNDLVSLAEQNKVTYKEFNSHSAYMMYKQDKKSKVAIVIAGGGYQEVCTFPESFPVAIELYKRGFTSFTFSYGVKENAFHNKAYKNDLVPFIKYLFDNQDELNIDMNDYLIIGFSASAHLVATLGSDNFGYKVMGLPKPKLMVLAYPVITMHKENAEVGSYAAMFGEHASEEDEHIYSIEEHVDKDFPPVYMFQADKDKVVKSINSKLMDEALTKHNVPHVYFTLDDDYHGYGLGTGTPVEGWLDKMLEFYKKI